MSRLNRRTTQSRSASTAPANREKSPLAAASVAGPRSTMVETLIDWFGITDDGGPVAAAANIKVSRRNLPHVLGAALEGLGKEMPAGRQDLDGEMGGDLAQMHGP